MAQLFDKGENLIRGNPTVKCSQVCPLNDGAFCSGIRKRNSKLDEVCTVGHGSTDGSGILVNLDGEIVGIIAQSYSAKGNNVVTGIAISQIKKLIENLSNNVSRAYIGIRGQDVTEELSDKTGIPKGVLISRVADDSPAMMAGMKEYDVIVKLGEHKVETIKQYHEQLGKYSTGDVVTVTAMRKGAEGYAEMTFDVTMGEV